jgi:hypothetical protein
MGVGFVKARERRIYEQKARGTELRAESVEPGAGV